MEFASSRTAAVRYPVRARVLPFRRSADPTGKRIIALVAADQGVTADEMLGKVRGTAQVALARQLAMYLLHVSKQWVYQDVGRLFGRDRTTVSHACAVIEERREDPVFDARVDNLEALLRPEAEEVPDAKAV